MPRRTSYQPAAGTGENKPENVNDHEQQARVHPALPCYSVVVPAPELVRSINVTAFIHGESWNPSQGRETN
jgi:hypothetical protein